MRGKGLKVCEHRLSDRITPAYAGKRVSAASVFSPFKDHPRLCGEKINVPHESKAQQGSPPPMRGKGDAMLFAYHMLGITPAYAGKSFHRVPVFQRLQDHPRLCGEKFNFLVM